MGAELRQQDMFVGEVVFENVLGKKVSKKRQGRTKRQFTHIDCFSGPGGICCGFRAAFIDTLLAIEKVESCVQTYSSNNPKTPVINKDIREVGSSDLSFAAGKSIDIVSAGMPCETFSTAGSKSRSFYDSRQLLFMEAIRLANLTSSRSILFENVPGILSKRVSRDSNILIIDELRRALSSNGFPFQHETILRSEEFGVPQKRKRFFLFATREDTPFSWPRVEIDAHTTTREAFVGLPKILHNEGDPQNSYNGESGAYADLMTNGRFWRLKKKTDYPSYHIAPNHRPGTIERYKLIKPGEGLKDLFEKLSDGERKNLQSQRILPKKWYIQRNRRLQWDRPSPTITSHCIDELIHPKLHRAPTVREVARLQSFPDLYVFPGGPVICPHIYETQDKYEQVGDAVPPLMAYYLGCAIKLALG